MAHKIVTLRRGFPYTTTRVHFQHSVQQIRAMLERFKCTRIGVLDNLDGDIPTTTLVFEKGGAAFLIEFPVTYYADSRGKRLNMNISGRIIHDRIKSILVDVEIGYLEFSQAMMAYRAIPAPDGRTVTLQEAYEQCGDRLPLCGFDIRLALPEVVER